MDIKWKPVVNYEGIYEISEYGEVKAFARTTNMPLKNGGKSNALKYYPERILNHKFSKDGHHRVKLCVNGVRKFYPVHRLVAFAFIDGYFEGAVVNHLEGNKDNNHYSNLEWTSVEANVHHAFDNGLMCTNRLTVEQVRDIRQKFKSKEMTVKELGEKYNRHPGYLYMVIDGRRHRDIKD